jgi:hypothetical protein
MSDTFSTSLAIRLPATGAYNNTWGAVLNANALQLLDTAIAGLNQVSIGSSIAYSMPAMSQGSDTPSRYFCLQFSGTPASAVTVTLPSSVVSKFYLIDNLATGQTLTFTYVGSTNTVTVKVGEKHLIWCDGANVWDCTTAGSTLLSGIAAVNFARVSRTAAEITASTIVKNVYSDVSNVNPFHALTLPGGSTITLDPTTGDVQAIALTGNYIFGVPANAVDGAKIELYVAQDSTGGRTATWNSVFVFESGIVPTLTAAPGSVDRFDMRYASALSKWLVTPFLNYTTPAGATYPLTISSNVTNWQLAPLLGATGAVSVVVTVNQGVVVSSVRASDPAMDLSGLPSGSTVTLVNNGYIIGCGGRGGSGAASAYNGTSGVVIQGGKGRPGGTAIVGPGIGRSFNCTNTNGHIWGGGGGGGGGSSNTPFANGEALAGGGGGGAGGGVGGPAGLLGNIYTLYPYATEPTLSGDGTAGPNGTGGSGGVGTTAGSGSPTVGVAGNGGNYGAAGGAGTNATPSGCYGTAGIGGIAGNAIALGGGSVVPASPAGSVLGIIS